MEVFQVLEKQSTETLGQYITRLRKEKGLSQRKLASLSKISNTTINRIESGETPKPDAPTLKAISEVLGMEDTVLLIAARYIKDNGNNSHSITTIKSEENSAAKDFIQIEKELIKIMDDIKGGPKEVLTRFNNQPNIDLEDIELFQDTIKMALKIVNRINKKTML